ncbi:dihydrofolate reductase [Peptoniphilus sp. KCTC 25270]|uniref:dihydrofolate reductase n=1 Tax=Peptoniphilus sp. KCTC 25270 TaxID=2897414 RepID=UPI001E4626A3|nr:dihydrofolate reductase [Peptoniphilus sp. KCTC 25270]MCD1147378.1 dihydrofolate reductase [Peptoniphilus sp. KCTC 25270]
MIVLLLVDQANAIAKEGKQILFIPEDLDHFRKMTTGQIVIMGRKTFENTGKLPNRTNIVLTSNPLDEEEDLYFVKTLEELFSLLEDVDSEKKVFCIGGVTLIQSLWGCLDSAYLTRVHTIIEGADRFIPDLQKEGDWILEKETPLTQKPYKSTIEYWRRKKVTE